MRDKLVSVISSMPSRIEILQHRTGEGVVFEKHQCSVSPRLKPHSPNLEAKGRGNPDLFGCSHQFPLHEAGVGRREKCMDVAQRPQIPGIVLRFSRFSQISMSLFSVCF